jgi:photosystem II stability/assembly factor-like uncharacterized protein
MKKLTILAFLIVLPIFNIYSQWIFRSVPDTNALNTIQFKDISTGWVAGNYGKIYKTTNGGISWIPQSTGSAFSQYYSLAFVNNTVGWLVGATQDTALTGRIYRTNNGGTSWVYQYPAPFHTFYSAFAIDSLTCYVAGGYNGMYAALLKTVNGGNNWSALFTSQYAPLRCSYFLNSSTGWVAGDNYIIKTINSGANWTPTYYSMKYYSIFFNDANTGWVGTDNGQLLKTTNGGISWLPNFTASVSSPIYSIQFPSSVTGYFTYSNLVFKTTNSGASWVPYETGTQSTLKGVSLISASTGFAAGTSGAVVFTSNGGGSFSTNSVHFHRYINKNLTLGNITYDTIAVSLPKSVNSVITDINVNIDTVVNTNDGELTFILKHQNISDTLIYRVGGSGSNFYRTILNDSAVTPIGAGMPPFIGSYKPSRPLSQFNYVSPNGNWYLLIKDSTLSKDRTGVIKSWGITVTYNTPILVEKISESIPVSFGLYQNYPNPFNPTTTIKFKVKETGMVSLKVYNILGKEVASLVNEEIKAGEYETKFDGSALSTGIYFYRFTAQDFSDTKKLVLIK